MTEKREPPPKPQKRVDLPPDETTFEGLLFKISNITDKIMSIAKEEEQQSQPTADPNKNDDGFNENEEENIGIGLKIEVEEDQNQDKIHDEDIININVDASKVTQKIAGKPKDRRKRVIQSAVRT